MMCLTKRNKAEELESIIKNKTHLINLDGEGVEVTTGPNKKDENYYVFIDLNEWGDGGINTDTLRMKTPIKNIKNIHVTSGRMQIQVTLEE